MDCAERYAEKVVILRTGSSSPSTKKEKPMRSFASSLEQ